MANEAYLSGGTRGLDVGDGKGNALMTAVGFFDGTGALVRTSSSNALPVSATVNVSTASSVAIINGSTLNVGQVTVASAVGASSWVGTQIIASSTNRYSVTVTNLNATGTIFVAGTSAVASSTGHGVPAGQSVNFGTRSGIWGIASSGQNQVSYAEEAP